GESTKHPFKHRGAMPGFSGNEPVLLMVPEQDGPVNVVAVRSGKTLCALQDVSPKGLWIDRVAFSPDGRLVAVPPPYDPEAPPNGQARVFEVATGRLAYTVSVPPGPPPTFDWRIRFTPDSRLIAVSNPNRLVVATAADGTPLTPPGGIAHELPDTTERETG